MGFCRYTLLLLLFVCWSRGFLIYSYTFPLATMRNSYNFCFLKCLRFYFCFIGYDTKGPYLKTKISITCHYLRNFRQCGDLEKHYLLLKRAVNKLLNVCLFVNLTYIVFQYSIPNSYKSKKKTNNLSSIKNIK